MKKTLDLVEKHWEWRHCSSTHGSNKEHITSWKTT